MLCLRQIDPNFISVKAVGKVVEQTIVNYLQQLILHLLYKKTV